MSTICVPDTAAVATVTEVRTLAVIPEWPEDPDDLESSEGPQCPEVSQRPEGRNEFENSEFYIEESLPSSLEWGRDAQVFKLLSRRLLGIRSPYFRSLFLYFC